MFNGWRNCRPPSVCLVQALSALPTYCGSILCPGCHAYMPHVPASPKCHVIRGVGCREACKYTRCAVGNAPYAADGGGAAGHRGEAGRGVARASRCDGSVAHARIDAVCVPRAMHDHAALHSTLWHSCAMIWALPLHMSPVECAVLMSAPACGPRIAAGAAGCHQ